MIEDTDPVHVLALQAFDGGSHRQVLRAWQAHSQHRFTTLRLPGHHWKWRMRHAAWTFAEQAAGLDPAAEPPAVVWCTDMLDLASWRGLAPAQLRELPTVCYMHENQLTYPDARRDERDLHYAFTNLLGAAAATAVWWNSAYHRDEFLQAMRRHLRRLPDHAPLAACDRIAASSRVLSPGYGFETDDQPDRNGPTERPQLLWAARWEDDKGPELLTAALHQLADNGMDFDLHLIGGRRAQAPACVAGLAERLGQRLRSYGWIDARAAYERVLRQSDIVVSTARHEFFGIAVVEAVAAGCFPVLPDRLAYPEVFAGLAGRPLHWYDGSLGMLTGRLAAAIGRWQCGELWDSEPDRGWRSVAAYDWSLQAPRWDAALADHVGGGGVQGSQ